MQPHSEMLSRIQEQLAEQTTEFHEICGALASLDARTLLPVNEELLREIDSLCDQRFGVGPCVQVSGLRA